MSKLNTTGKYFCKDIKVAYLAELGLPLFKNNRQHILKIILHFKGYPMNQVAKADENLARLLTYCVEWFHLSVAEIKLGALFYGPQMLPLSYICNYMIWLLAALEK